MDLRTGVISSLLLVSGVTTVCLWDSYVFVDSGVQLNAVSAFV